MEDPRRPIVPERLRRIPRSFSWIDRDILRPGLLEDFTGEEILLYFFLALVAGPEGTSFWSYRAIAKLLKIPEGEIIGAIRGLIEKDLIAFRYPTFQVLSLPPRSRSES